jgi:large subunit ribosomal protein L9
MEVLLLEDINGIGKKNDLLVVGDGYALNCLLPQRKALVATPTVRRRYADEIRKRAMEKERDRQRQSEAASALAGKTVSFTRKASKTGKLYAAISEDAIAEALKDQHGIDIEADAVELQEHIKATGNFKAMVKLGGVSPQSITVAVIAE